MFLVVEEAVKFRIFGVDIKTVKKKQVVPFVKDHPTQVFDKQGVTLTVTLVDEKPHE